MVSKGLTRGKSVGLMVVPSAVASGETRSAAAPTSPPCAAAYPGRHRAEGLAGDVEDEEETVGETADLPWSAPRPGGLGFGRHPTKAEARAIARAKGYEGEACPECQNFTMVRNGTCLKCETCGSTTGCS